MADLLTLQQKQIAWLQDKLRDHKSGTTLPVKPVLTDHFQLQLKSSASSSASSSVSDVTMNSAGSLKTAGVISMKPGVDPKPSAANKQPQGVAGAGSAPPSAVDPNGVATATTGDAQADSCKHDYLHCLIMV